MNILINGFETVHLRLSIFTTMLFHHNTAAQPGAVTRTFPMGNYRSRSKYGIVCSSAPHNVW